MEFTELGKHCAFARCKQQDFLPFNCDACGDHFCVEHRSYREHQCPGRPWDNVVLPCARCGLGITLLEGEDTTVACATHQNTGKCVPQEKTTCPVKNCRVKLTATNVVKCGHCRMQHCLTHRYRDSHECAHPLERALHLIH